jgi:hypothetical protein
MHNHTRRHPGWPEGRVEVVEDDPLGAISLGTPVYMGPEPAMGRGEIDARCDVPCAGMRTVEPVVARGCTAADRHR